MIAANLMPLSSRGGKRFACTVSAALAVHATMLFAWPWPIGEARPAESPPLFVRFVEAAAEVREQPHIASPEPESREVDLAVARSRPPERKPAAPQRVQPGSRTKPLDLPTALPLYPDEFKVRVPESSASHGPERALLVVSLDEGGRVSNVSSVDGGLPEEYLEAIRPVLDESRFDRLPLDQGEAVSRFKIGVRFVADNLETH